MFPDEVVESSIHEEEQKQNETKTNKINQSKMLASIENFDVEDLDESVNTGKPNDDNIIRTTVNP